MARVRKNEKGAVLIVSMVILLAMTIVGLAGMEITTLEEKMAGGMRDRNIAFQSAEATLRDAENYLSSVAVLPEFDSTGGFYPLPTDGTKRWETITWTSSAAVRTYSGEGFDELASTPGYIVENLATASSNESLETGAPEDTQSFYRITVRSEGLTNDSVVILQSVFKR